MSFATATRYLGNFRNSRSGVDDTAGPPQVEFTFNAQGAFGFGRFTSDHVPNPSGEHLFDG